MFAMYVNWYIIYILYTYIYMVCVWCIDKEMETEQLETGTAQEKPAECCRMFLISPKPIHKVLHSPCAGSSSLFPTHPKISRFSLTFCRALKWCLCISPLNATAHLRYFSLVIAYCIVLHCIITRSNDTSAPPLNATIPLCISD